MLALLLDGLREQKYRDFEVVVIDDGSSDGSFDEAAMAASDDLQVHVLRTDGVGAVEARRRGVDASTGRYLAFTDSDCVPDPMWLQNAMEAFTDGVDIVQGRTEPVRPLGLLERSVWITQEDGLYATCNVLYRREAFERAGGFDDAGRLLGFRPGAFSRGLGFGEDALLAWRVRRSGSAVFVPDAVVRHAVARPPDGEALRRSWMAGAFPTLVREIPELRATMLRGGVFLGTRRIPMYAALLSFLVGRRGIAAAALAWWVGARAREAMKHEQPLATRAEAVVLECASDAITGAALVAGSVRARKLVL
jgi:cellulose synthase/poly-beta-1,6-N-acetylglucosamine synthase-like glycosyltransferase